MNGCGKNDLIPVHLENNTFNFYLNREVKSVETNTANDAEHCFAKSCRQSGNEYGRTVRSKSPTTTLNRDVAPIDDDIETVEESRADVETVNEEEESSEAEITTVEMSPKNPMSREEQEHEDSGQHVYRSWCAACVEGRGVGGHLHVEPLEEEERERTTPMVAFDCGFLTQENADTFPILICRDNRHGQTGVTCCKGKGPTAYFIPLLVDFIQDLDFRRILFERRE